MLRFLMWMTAIAGTGWVLWAYRRRLRFAVRVLSILYPTLMFVSLIESGFQLDRMVVVLGDNIVEQSRRTCVQRFEAQQGGARVLIPRLSPDEPETGQHQESQRSYSGYTKQFAEYAERQRYAGKPRQDDALPSCWMFPPERGQSDGQQRKCHA